MELNILSLINGIQSKYEFDFTIGSSDDNPILPPDDVVFTSPLSVCGSVTNTAGYMELKSTYSIDYDTHCSKCLKDISGTFTGEFVRTVVVKGTLQNEDDDTYLEAKNGLINIDRDLVEDLLVEFPFAIKCDDECLGICSKCGQNLNEGTCNCKDKKEIDPRLAGLLKFINNED
ncbi:MAG: DUF177 domain-containing protein [Clostridia bacterium]|nr:DUF177 domain-containing protein [Clostridia bacterium]